MQSDAVTQHKQPPKKAHFWFEGGVWHVETTHFHETGFSPWDAYMGLCGLESEAGVMSNAPKVATAHFLLAK